MDKYLLEILKDVNTIIIPGLGALTITDHRTGEIMFMSYLKHDDGALVNYIAEKEGMDPNDAKNLVAKYVREILAKLDQGETYDMFQFGSFYKNDDDVDFRAWKDSNAASENPVEATEITPEPEENVFIPPVTEEVKEEAKEDQSEPAAIIEEPIIEVEETIVAPVETTPEPTREFNIAEKEEQEKVQEKLENLKKAKESQKEKKKRGVGFYILITLIVLIVTGGTLIGVYFDDVKKHLPFLAEEVKTKDSSSELDEMKETLGLTDETEENNEDSIEATTEDEAEEMTSDEETATETDDQNEQVTESVPAQETTSYPEATPGKYHIIAGAFSSIENANRMAAKLNEGGYKASVKMQGSLHFVSAKSFDSKEAANAELGNVRTIATNAWVYAWP